MFYLFKNSIHDISRKFISPKIHSPFRTQPAGVFIWNKSPLSAAHLLFSVSVHWGVWGLAGATPLEQTSSPGRQHWPAVAPPLEWDFVPTSLPHARVLSDLILTFFF